MSTPKETVARAMFERGMSSSWDAEPEGHQGGWLSDAQTALASLRQHRDDIARAIHTRICEQSIEDCLDPVWRGRCVKAADSALDLFDPKEEA